MASRPARIRRRDPRPQPLLRHERGGPERGRGRRARWSAKPSLSVDQLYAILKDPRGMIDCTSAPGYPDGDCGFGFPQADAKLAHGARRDAAGGGGRDLLRPGPTAPTAGSTAPVGLTWIVDGRGLAGDDDELRPADDRHRRRRGIHLHGGERGRHDEPAGDDHARHRAAEPAGVHRHQSRGEAEEAAAKGRVHARPTPPRGSPHASPGSSPRSRAGTCSARPPQTCPA